MDMGLEKVKGMIQEMGKLSDRTVSIALEAYMEGLDNSEEEFTRAEELRVLQEDVSELAVEIIARYQPVASDLRFIKSCMEVAYGFSRFGRYAYDISEVLKIFGDLSSCDKKPIQAAGNKVKEMISLAIEAFTKRDVNLANNVREMDNVVDGIYLDYVQRLSKLSKVTTQCATSGTLVLRYLERIADHAAYIGDSVIYVVSGTRAARK
jgi:phosphate transport system protein